MTENCEDSTTERYSLLTLYISKVHLLQLMSQHWLLLTEVHTSFWFFSLAFSHCSFSVPEYHITFTCHVSLGSFWLWQFLVFFLFLLTLTVLKSTNLVFCRMSFRWNLSELFPNYTGVLSFWRKVKKVVPFHHITSHQGCITSTWLTTVDVDLDHPAEVVLSSFSTVKLVFPPLSILQNTIPYIHSLEGSHYVQSTLKEWKVMFHFLEDGVST